MSNPGTNVTDQNGAVALDHIQSTILRVCFIAKRTNTTLSDNWVDIGVWSRSETGGPSTNYGGSFWDSGYDPQNWVMDHNNTDLDDPWTEFDPRANGYRLTVSGSTAYPTFTEQLFWAQIPVGIDGKLWGWAMFASAMHNKLWLRLDPGSNIDYVRNVLVWEWIPHPNTPTWSPLGLVSPKPDFSEGMGSKYDIFTGA
jgi:hypothetical protein